MVNDRGTIKWTSIMMPEHIKLLNEMWDELERKDKPILDDQQKLDIDLKLQCAIKDDLTVEVKYFSDGDYLTAKDKLQMIDRKKIMLQDGKEIPLNDVLDVYID
ncbi:hypothetical protein GCM10011409_38160 [Lentibacillus populi]|uniref:YolD-like family protein n=1 Tax=Lentibacillus populi TaxID=1827502 RepID=A0A9W5U0U6_9BACI|nr:YolD-like family protein [Lentibacillus populi]GGB56944.1 hypothetical protein GCM10011409_38160 [Lentibacillus populi]